MIQSVLYFLLFSGLFYFSYKALFSRMQFFRLNRALLLLIPLLSMGIAFIAPRFTAPESGIITLISSTLPVIEITAATGREASTANALNWWLIIYSTGALLVLFYMARGFWNLRKILEQAEPLNSTNRNVLVSPRANGAFNFAHFIVLPAHLPHSKNYSAILLHEQEHLRQKHYLDNLYYNLFTLLAWFNPFVHLLGRELRQVHECQADAAVIRTDKNIENYAHTLLSSTLGGDITFPGSALSASPFFNSSLIKTRITMIYKNKTPKWRGILYLAILPLIAGMTMLACSKEPPAQEAEAMEKAINMADVDKLPLAESCEEGLAMEEMQKCFQQAIIRHVSENFKYPEEARELGMEGRLFTSFVIDKNGEIGEIVIERGLTPPTNSKSYTAEELKASEITNSQVLTLVQRIPKFKRAAQKDGKAVPMKFTLPINFKLPEKKEEAPQN